MMSLQQKGGIYLGQRERNCFPYPREPDYILRQGDDSARVGKELFDEGIAVDKVGILLGNADVAFGTRVSRAGCSGVNVIRRGNTVTKSDRSKERGKCK